MIETGRSGGLDLIFDRYPNSRKLSAGARDGMSPDCADGAARNVAVAAAAAGCVVVPVNRQL